MSYEPEHRYARDRAHQLEIDKPFDSQPQNDRGQFWSVSGSGAATVAGLVGGWWFARIDPYELEETVNSFLRGDWFAPICVLVGGVLGFVGAYAPVAYKKD